MLGDNRNNSNDSRFWQNHYVAKDDILGKAVLRYWPLPEIGTIE
jgi:signal peptidase I